MRGTGSGARLGIPPICALMFSCILLGLSCASNAKGGAGIGAADAPGPAIPGLETGAVPQGLAHSASLGRYFISAYFDDGRPSVVFCIDAWTGALAGSTRLLEEKGRFHRGHVGGLAVDADSLWVSSEGRVWRYALRDLAGVGDRQAVEEGEAVAQSSFAAETRASYMAAWKGKLYVGEFAHRGVAAYPTRRTHHLADRTGALQYAWIAVYDLVASGAAGAVLAGAEGPSPEAAILVRDDVQGLVVTDDAFFISLSWGRASKSLLARYDNPISAQGSAGGKLGAALLGDGSSIPLYFLDGQNLEAELSMPPMAEGIAMAEGRIATLFESGAWKYRGTGRRGENLLLAVPPAKGH